MSIEIAMPALSPTMEKGTLAKWLVKVGDQVKVGDALAEIETDKATMEFEAPEDGLLSKILVLAGTDDVPVGTVIALIGSEEGAAEVVAPEDVPLEGLSASGSESVAVVAETPSALASAAAYGHPARTSTADPRNAMTDGTMPPKVSPLARRIAQAKGVDLSRITGSGPAGRIIKADLDVPDRIALAGPGTAPMAVSSLIVYPPPAGVPHEVIKLGSMRKTIARRLTEAKQTVPHFYLSVDIRLDALLKLRAEMNASSGSRNVKLSLNDFLIKALATTLEVVPDANVQYSGDELYRFHRIDVSMAVAIPGGLVTPVIVDAGGKRLTRISVEARDLAARARAGKLSPEEYQGGTVSLSNLGMYGMKQMSPVINPPQALIMGVGVGEERPYVVDKALTIAAVLTATISVDHRAIDGAVGADFLRTFKNVVEAPMDIIL